MPPCMYVINLVLLRYQKPGRPHVVAVSTRVAKRCLLQVGRQPHFQGFIAKDHVALAEALDMVDFDSASEVGRVQ